MGSRGALLAAGLGLLLHGCHHDWDAYAPLPGAAAGGAGGAGGAATTSSTSTAGGAPGTGGAGGMGGMGGASGTGGMGGGATPLEVLASVAECIDPAAPDPVACEQIAGAGMLTIDGSDGMPAHAWYTYLRFDPDPAALAGKTIDALALRLVVGPAMGDASTQGGEIWEVAPFSAADLSVAAPAPVGMAPIAASPGAVTNNQAVTWDLPIGLLAAGGPVHLGVLPVNSDGVDYYRPATAMPPRLVVTLH